MGSAGAAWLAFALNCARANVKLVADLQAQSAAIRVLRGEVALLRKRIAERRPKGGRAPLADSLVERIEAEIKRGGSDRGIAASYGVSHMTVDRRE